MSHIPHFCAATRAIFKVHRKRMRLQIHNVRFNTPALERELVFFVILPCLWIHVHKLIKLIKLMPENLAHHGLEKKKRKRKHITNSHTPHRSSHSFFLFPHSSHPSHSRERVAKEAFKSANCICQTMVVACVVASSF
ncbi:Hypothetical protein, putative, partial [Bodo saltans]